MIPLQAKAKGWHQRAIAKDTLAGKNISHHSYGFSGAALVSACLIDIKRTGKLQTHQMVVIEVIDPHGFSSDCSGEARQSAMRPDGRARDFKANRGRFR